MNVSDSIRERFMRELRAALLAGRIKQQEYTLKQLTVLYGDNEAVRTLDEVQRRIREDSN